MPSRRSIMAEPTLRRSSRARTSNKRYHNEDNPIVIDDDESTAMTPDKSADMSRRTSGTSTPATSVSALYEDASADDAKPAGVANGLATAGKSPLITVKRKGRKTIESAVDPVSNAPTKVKSATERSGARGRSAAATLSKNVDEPIDLTSTQETLRTVSYSQLSAGGSRARSSRLGKAKAQDSPDTVVNKAPLVDVRKAANSGKGKNKSKQEDLFDLGDFVFDSEDEADAVRKFNAEAASIRRGESSLQKNSLVSNDAIGGSLTREESEFESEDTKPRKRARLSLAKRKSSTKVANSDNESDDVPLLERRKATRVTKTPSTLEGLGSDLSDNLTTDEGTDDEISYSEDDSEDDSEDESVDVPLAGPSDGAAPGAVGEDRRWETAKQRAKRIRREQRELRADANARRTGRARKKDRRSHYQKSAALLHEHHPELKHVWRDLKNIPKREVQQAAQPSGLTIKLLPFQLEGLNWLTKQEKSAWKGGILADEMGMGKTIQIVSLFLSDRKKPNLVVAPTVAILQWRNEIAKYTQGFNVVVWHGANRSSDAAFLKNADVVLASYGVLESAFRKQVTGFRRKGAIIKEKSVVHGVKWHRVVLDEAHNIKERATNTAKAAFELKATYRWCLSGTPLQNRVGELYSMIRFLDGDPFSYYYCKRCPCKSLHWQFSDRRNCDKCGHTPMHHTCFWNNEILKPIQRFGTTQGEGRDSFERLRLLLEHMMLRRTKLERADDMGLPPRTIEVRRDNFNEEEEDLYESLYTDTTRKFSTFLDQGTVLNNYSNIFTLLTRMRQLACHPDLVLRSKTGIAQKLLGDETASIHVCRICQEEAEDAIMSKCRHIFCRECVRQWVGDGEKQDGRPPECPYCHMTLTIDLEGDALDPPRQNDHHGARQGILSRLDMNKWRSSTKIEALVEELTQLRSEDKTIKSLVFSQFVNFLDLIAFRLTRAGFSICRLEGNMSPEARNKTIEHFMNNPGVTVFLVSLKAGGVALNLTEASRVYLMDPWWNPSVEVQAADRVHRLGQHRPIIVKRMVIENSIESRIIELQNKKSAMIEAAIGKDESAMGRLSVADLNFLFSL